MRYYYILFDDDISENWFMVTMDKIYSQRDRHPNQRFVNGKYNIIFNRGYSEHLISGIVESNGMALNRIFDSKDKRDRRLLIRAIIERNDGIK